jgi:ubiquinone/menaquinone biosynthesis C-methylase UbiE
LDDLIDAEELASRYSVEELAERAEAYFARISDWSYHLAKPLGSVAEAPTIFAHFAAMLSALDLTPEMQLLDFGAGSCWTSHMFAQLGCVVTACDVSPTALAIGRQKFANQPLFGTSEPPTTMVFDGHRLDLADQSVDRIACMDAFHHVPNWEEVLTEFHRVLRPGGRAVLAEGGPNHSKMAQSQYEMRNFEVVERDLVVDDFARLADAAGFADTRVGLYSGLPWLIPAEEFAHELETGLTVATASRTFLENHRLVVLLKTGTSQLTSRGAAGLSAHIAVEMFDHSAVRVVVTNTGAASWLGSSVQRGTVNLGVQLLDATGRVKDLDFQRVPIVEDPHGAIQPGEVVEVNFELPVLLDGDQVAFDLVAEGVAWFATLAASTVEVRSQ